ncbi:FMN-binding protein [Alkaliphilus crotonatoxidans]
MKKMLAVLLAVAMVLPMVLAGFVNAADAPATAFEGPGVKPAIVFLDGVKQTLETRTQYKGGVTYLPVREITELLGLHIHYAEATRSVYILNSENASNLPTAEKAETMNIFVQNAKIDTPVIINEDNKALIPASNFAAALGLYYYEDVLSNSVYFFSEGSALKDGTYTAVGLDSRGWVPQVDVTIAGGKITAVTYNEYNVEDGRGKKTDEEYNTNWKARYPEADLASAIDSLEKDLLAVQTPVLVDSVSGATGASSSFKALVREALGKAMAAKAIEDEIVALGGEVVDASYRDGKYVIIGLTASNGWTPQVDLVVEDGKIVSVVYNSYNEAGEGKRENGAGYLTNWTNRYPDVDPVAIIAEREAQLVKTQDPNMVDVATGATGWGTDLKLLTAGALNQAKRADIEVTEDSTIYVFHGEPTASSAYYVQFLALAEGGKIVDADYVEYQTGSPLAKPHNPSYLERWAGRTPDVLQGRNQLDIKQGMIDKFLENKAIDEVDTKTGATNWGKGILQLAPKAVDVIEK